MRFSNYGLWLARLFVINIPSNKIEAKVAFCFREHLKYEADLTFKRAWEIEAFFPLKFTVQNLKEENIFISFLFSENKSKFNKILWLFIIMFMLLVIGLKIYRSCSYV